MTLRWLAVALLVAGCGPKNQQSSVEDPSSAPAQEPSTTAGEPSDSADGNGSAPEAASPEDVAAVVQAALDDEELTPHLKLGDPGRFPVKVAGEGITAELGLTQSSEPVVVVVEPTSDRDPVLVVTGVTFDGDRATVTYRYDIEGLKGSAVVAKRDGSWQLLRSRLVQH